MPKRKANIKKWCTCPDWRKCSHLYYIRLRAYVNGKVVREKREDLKTADEAEALVRAAEWEGVYQRLGRELSQRDGAAPPGATTIEDLCKLDLKEGQSKGLTQDALDWRELAYKWIQTHFGKLNSAKVLTDYDKLLDYNTKRKDGLIGRPSSADTRRREFQIIKRLCETAMRKGAIFAMPQKWPDVGKHKVKESQRGFFIPPQVFQAFLAELDEDAKEAAAIYAGTALRAEELPRVDDRNIEPLAYTFHDTLGAPVAEIVAKLRLTAAGTKDNDERWVPLTREIHELLVARRARLGPDVPLFGDLEPYRAQWRSASRKIGFHRNIHPRAMRHTLGTLLAQKSVIAAKEILGHADLSTTQKYVHVHEEWMANAMAFASGHIPQGTFLKEPLKLDAVGRGGQIRTGDPLTPSRQKQLEEHLTSCKHCEDQVATCAQMERNIGGIGHTTGHIAPPDQPSGSLTARRRILEFPVWEAQL